MRPAVFFTLVGIVVVAAMTSARGVMACEDGHPPVVATPQEMFAARGDDDRAMVTISIDPRGVGSVAPLGDARDAWIDGDDRAGAWHYREWQWWKGHPWGDSCRPRFYSDVEFHARPKKSNAATITYRIDGFDCRQVFLLPSMVDSQAPYWDIVTTVCNVSGGDVEEYGQFFACYTPLNRKRSFWYWDESNELVLFGDRGVTHLNGYIANPEAYFNRHGAIPHCPRGGGRIVGRWRRPLMVSQASPAGWRSVVMIETTRAAALAQGIEGGAMDYILFPDPATPSFAAGAAFSCHIRHVMLKSPALPTSRQLDPLWDSFERSHESVHDAAAKVAADGGGQDHGSSP